MERRREDTDRGPATVGLDAATLESRDLVPFAGRLLGERASGRSSSRAPSTPPTTRSPRPRSQPAVATDLLREELGFEGVAITDDLGAGAVEAVTDPGDAAVEALSAGIDLVQVTDPADVERVRRALLAAVEAGELPAERLEEASRRIARLGASG